MHAAGERLNYLSVTTQSQRRIAIRVKEAAADGQETKQETSAEPRINVCSQDRNALGRSRLECPARYYGYCKTIVVSISTRACKANDAIHTMMRPVDWTTVEDDKIVRLCSASNPEREILSQIEGGGSVVKISEDACVKIGYGVQEDEANNQRRASALIDHNIVRVPRVHRFFSAGGLGYLVMEFIGGTHPEDVLGKTCVDLVIKAISHFADIRSDRPGSLGGGPSRGLVWSDYMDFSPTSIGDIEQYFNYYKKLQTKVDLAEYPLVLCHMDIACRNLLMQEDGSLCLLDWASAGFYPKFFEVAAMRINAQSSRDGFTTTLLERIGSLDERSEAQCRSIECAPGLHLRYVRYSALP